MIFKPMLSKSKNYSWSIQNPHFLVLLNKNIAFKWILADLATVASTWCGQYAEPMQCPQV